VELQRVAQSLEVVLGELDLVSQSVVLSDVEATLVGETMKTEQKLTFTDVRHYILLQTHTHTPIYSYKHTHTRLYQESPSADN